MSSRDLVAVVVVACHLLALVLFASPAVAAAPLQLTWEAPPECPSARDVEQQVLRLAQLADASERHVVAQAHVTSKMAGYELVLRAETAGVQGERRFQGSSCPGVVDAAVLTLALMLNPEAQLEAPAEVQPQPPDNTRATKPLESALPSGVAEPSEQSNTSTPWVTHLLLGAALGPRTGALPSPGVEPALELTLLTGPLGLWAYGSLIPAQTARLELQDSNAGARLWLHSAGLRAGWQVRLSQFRVGPVLGVEITKANGRGTGISEPQTASIRWLSGSVGAVGGWMLNERLGLSLGGFALVPLRRPRFFIEDVGRVYQPQRVGIRAHLGVHLSLW